MTAVPRIYRAIPKGAVTTASEPIDVIVTLAWVTSPELTEVAAMAVAWTRTEVEVEWQFDGALRRDWVDAVDVRRLGRPRTERTARSDRPSTRPPRVDTRHRPRW